MCGSLSRELMDERNETCLGKPVMIKWRINWEKLEHLTKARQIIQVDTYRSLCAKQQIVTIYLQVIIQMQELDQRFRIIPQVTADRGKDSDLLHIGVKSQLSVTNSDLSKHKKVNRDSQIQIRTDPNSQYW